MNILNGREDICLETYSDSKQIDNYGEKEKSATTKRRRKRRTTMKRDPFAGIDATFSRSSSHLLCLSLSRPLNDPKEKLFFRDKQKQGHIQLDRIESSLLRHASERKNSINNGQ